MAINGSPTCGDVQARRGSSFHTPQEGLAYNGTRPPYAQDREQSKYALLIWPCITATDLQSPALARSLKRLQIATKYRTLPHTVLGPRNNPATWQHMVNLLFGLRLSNALEILLGLNGAGKQFARKTGLYSETAAIGATKLAGGERKQRLTTYLHYRPYRDQLSVAKFFKVPTP